MDGVTEDLVAKWTQCISSSVWCSRGSDCAREQLRLREQAVFHDLTEFGLEQTYQNELAPYLKARHAAEVIPDGLRFVGGLDISYDQEHEERAIAVLAVLHFPSLKVAHVHAKEVKLVQPYIPSYLAFREADHLLALIEECPQPRPQLLFVDGNGRLHEREAGLGVAIGARSNMPTVAVAKTYQPVRHGLDLDQRFDVHAMAALCRSSLRYRGDWLAIPDASCQRTLGAVGIFKRPGALLIKSQALLSSPHPESVRPVYVSAGHRLSLTSCIALTLACCTEARVPQPIRIADHQGRELLRKSTIL